MNFLLYYKLYKFPEDQFKSTLTLSFIVWWSLFFCCYSLTSQLWQTIGLVGTEFVLRILNEYQGYQLFDDII